MFKIQHFKASFITKLNTFKTNLEVNSISKSVLSKCAFTFTTEISQFCEQTQLYLKDFYMLELSKVRFVKGACAKKWYLEVSKGNRSVLEWDLAVQPYQFPCKAFQTWFSFINIEDKLSGL